MTAVQLEVLELEAYGYITDILPLEAYDGETGQP